MRKRTLYIALDSDQTSRFDYANGYSRKPKKYADTDLYGDPATRFAARDNDKLAEAGVELCVTGLRTAGIDIQPGQVIKLTINVEVLK